MPLGTEVGLGSGRTLIDGNPAAPRKGAQQPSPLFGPLGSGTVAHLSHTAELFIHSRYHVISIRLLSNFELLSNISLVKYCMYHGVTCSSICDVPRARALD